MWRGENSCVVIPYGTVRARDGTRKRNRPSPQPAPRPMEEIRSFNIQPDELPSDHERYCTNHTHSQSHTHINILALLPLNFGYIYL